MTKGTHRHKVTHTDTRAFSGPVRAQGQNQAAHGNVCFIDHCACGATRKTNANAGQTERGAWVEPVPRIVIRVPSTDTGETSTQAVHRLMFGKGKP